MKVKEEESNKLPVQAGMRIHAYSVFRRAIDDGVSYGWNRAHKHTDEPDADTIKDQITEAVLNEVCEYFDFGPIVE